MASDKPNLANYTFTDIDIKRRGASLLGEGAYGLTWKTQYRPKGASAEKYQAVVIKILKTDTIRRHGSDPYQDFLEEIEHLRRLRHQGVVRIIRQGECESHGQQTLYYLTEYEKTRSLDNFLKNLREKGRPVSLEFVFVVLSSILDALSYCHRHDIVHLDLKPDNILVKAKGNDPNNVDHCVLIDFGKAKALCRQDGRDETTPGGGAWNYVHENLRKYLRRNRVPKEVFERGAPGFDLFALSKILTDDIFPLLDEADQSHSEFRFLKQLAKSLLNESAGTKDFHLFSAEDGLQAIQRFRSNTGLNDKPIRLSTGLTVGTSALVREIIDTLEFQRLRKVTQLSLAHLVYPSATHTRFSHSIGVYHMAGKYATALFKEPYFSIKYSQNDIDILKIRALLHDIGHYPMAHYLEELDATIGKSLQLDHTKYGERIRSGELNCKESGQKTLHKVLHDAGILKEVAFAMPEKQTLMDAIINGPVDCDKLDYLVRDGLSCGVPYAESIDVDRFLSALTWDVDKNKNCVLAITPKGVAAAETILTARYQLFAEVYWHKTCRSAVAMIKEAFYTAFKMDLITQEYLDEILMNKDDSGVLEWLFCTLYKKKPQVASDLIGNALFPGGKRALYKRVTTYSSSWEAHHIVTSLYNHIGQRGFNQLRQFRSDLVNKLNKTGRKQIKGWESLKNHHLLVDMPPADKDSLGELTVKYDYDKKATQLSMISNVVKSLNIAFNQKVRRVRIFSHPAFTKQISEIIKKDPGYFDVQITNLLSHR